MTEIEAHDIVLAYVIGRFVPDPQDGLLRCTPRTPGHALQYPLIVDEAVKILQEREERILAGEDPSGCCYNDGVKVGAILGVRKILVILERANKDYFNGTMPVSYPQAVTAICMGATFACDKAEREIRERA